METVLGVLELALPLLYATAFVLYCIYFFKRDSVSGALAKPLLLLTAAAHLTYGCGLAVVYGHHPMASAGEVLSMVALALALVYLVIESWRKNKSTGMFVLPFVVVIQTISSIIVEPTTELKPILEHPLFAWHTGTVTLGYSAFFLSAVYGLMYLMFHRALRRKKFGLIFERLPSLDKLAKLHRGATLVGFAFLTISIILGIWWAGSAVDRFWLDPKVALTAVVWLSYGLALVSHYLLKWPARRVVTLALVAFGLMVAAWALVRLLVTSWHSFGA